MRATFAITIKELMLLRRDLGGLITLFLMPLMFIVVFSLALGGLYEPDEAESLEVPVSTAGAGEAAARAVERLDAVDGLTMLRQIDGQPLDPARVAALVAAAEYPVGIVFPEGFTAALDDPRLLTGGVDLPLRVTAIVDPAASAPVTAPIEAALRGALQQEVGRALSSAGVEALLAGLGASLPAEARQQLAAMQQAAGGDGQAPPLVTVDRQVPPGVEREQFPSTYQQNVPSYTVLGVFFIATVMITSVFRERTSGAMRRLRAAPVGRAPIVLGKLIPYYLINLVQIVIMFAVGRLIFGLELGSVPALLVVSLPLALTATGLGMAIANLARSETQGIGLAVMLVLTLAALGGSMVPSFIMPEAMQLIGRVTPHAWAIQGFQDVLVRGQGLGGVWLEAGVLSIYAVVFTAVGVWRFRFE